MAGAFAAAVSLGAPAVLHAQTRTVPPEATGNMQETPPVAGSGQTRPAVPIPNQSNMQLPQFPNGTGETRQGTNIPSQGSMRPPQFPAASGDTRTTQPPATATTKP